jgi:hypothetical protein
MNLKIFYLTVEVEPLSIVPLWIKGWAGLRWFLGLWLACLPA